MSGSSLTGGQGVRGNIKEESGQGALRGKSMRRARLQRNDSVI
ncbi:hypothetical protein [Pigmentiphaga litoralis]